MNNHQHSPGDQFRFVYSASGKAVSFPDHTEHSHQLITIVKRLNEPNTEVPPMYSVRADDDWIGVVFEDELHPPEAQP